MSERQTANQERKLTDLDASVFSSPREHPERPPAQELHVCPNCDSELVYPIDWEPAANRRWSVALRCPDCEWAFTGIYDQDLVDRFDEALDRGTEQLLDDLNALARANMEQQVNRFVAALWADEILPEDF